MARVVRFHQTGGPELLRIEELEVGAPGPGEMRIRIEAIGLNRAEAIFRSGMHLDQPRLPARLGYEASGVVEALGGGVQGFKIGEAVSVIPAFSMNDYGVYAEQAIVPATAVLKRPAGLSAVEAAAVWPRSRSRTAPAPFPSRRPGRARRNHRYDRPGRRT